METTVSKPDLLRLIALRGVTGEGVAVARAAEVARSLPGPELQALALFTAQRTEREVHPIFCFRATRMLHPWRLLSLWLYASARGLSASREVVELMVHDPNARELLRGEPVSEELLRQFYVRNEDAIVICVGEMLHTISASRGAGPGNFKEE